LYMYQDQESRQTRFPDSMDNFEADASRDAGPPAGNVLPPM